MVISLHSQHRSPPCIHRPVNLASSACNLKVCWIRILEDHSMFRFFPCTRTKRTEIVAVAGKLTTSTWLANVSKLKMHYHSHIIHDHFRMPETIAQQFPNPVILSVKVYRISSFLLGLCCLILRHGPTQIVKGRNWGKVVNIVTLTCRHGIPSGFKGTSRMLALFDMDIVSTWSSTINPSLVARQPAP